MQSTSGTDVGLDLSSVFAQLQETSKGMPPPKLVIIEHHSLARESFTKDGQQKNVHIVVKNTPFVVTVGLTGSIMRGRIIDFSTLTIETHLLYDCEDAREVPYMKQKPVEYKGKVNDKADQMSLDVRISVLSSHCENLCFRLRFQAVDARSGQPIPALTVLSDPIKVISKPDQITKKGAAPAERKRKRTANDNILESLARIEEQQKEHFELLTRMREEARADRQLAQPVTSSSQFSLSNFDVPSNLFGNLPDLSVEAFNAGPDQPTTSTSTSTTTLVTLPLAAPNPPAATTFEASYDALIEAYLKLPPSERPEKIRRIVRASSAKKTEAFGEMIAIFNAQGLQKALPDCSQLGITVPCGETGGGEAYVCPHQQRLAEIDTFYNELLNL